MYNEFFQRTSYNFTHHLQNNLHLTEYNLCISNEPSLFQGLVCRCSNLMTVAVCSIAYRSCCMGFEPRTQRRVTKSSTFATDSFATREGKPTQDCNGNWKPSARCLEKFIKAMSLLIISYPQTLNDGQFGHIFTQQNALLFGVMHLWHHRPMHQQSHHWQRPLPNLTWVRSSMMREKNIWAKNSTEPSC